MKKTLSELIRNGEFFYGVEGTVPEQIYKYVTEKMSIDSGVDKKVIYDALCARETIMSTAVGNGIALPHARTPVIKNDDKQMVHVVYLKEPIDMNAPDGRSVYAMFVILTSNPQTHQEILTALVSAIGNIKVRKLLEAHADKDTLLREIEKIG